MTQEGCASTEVSGSATLYEAAEVMAGAGVGALVVGDGDPPAGIVTERDLVGALAELLWNARHARSQSLKPVTESCDG